MKSSRLGLTSELGLGSRRARVIYHENIQARVRYREKFRARVRHGEKKSDLVLGIVENI